MEQWCLCWCASLFCRTPSSSLSSADQGTFIFMIFVLLIVIISITSPSSSSNFQHEESDKHSLALNGCLRPSNNRITRSLVIIVLVIIVMGDNYCHNISIFLVDILNFLYLDVFYLSKCLDSHFHQTRGHPVLSFTPHSLRKFSMGVTVIFTNLKGFSTF